MARRKRRELDPSRVEGGIGPDDKPSDFLAGQSRKYNFDFGRIYETRGGPEHLRWFWSFAVQGPMTRSNRVATFEEAKAQFQKSWDEWKKLEEVP
jgi:hypothetical protein